MSNKPEFAGNQNYTYHVCRYHENTALTDSIPPCHVFHFLALATPAKKNEHLQEYLDASLKGEMATIRQLKEESKNTQAVIPIQQMALAAAERARAEILAFCFQNGALPDGDIMSALHRGGTRDIKMYKATLDGILIDPGKGVLTGPLLLSFSITQGPKIVKYILSRGVKPDPRLLSKACRFTDTQTVEVLLTSEAVEVKNSGALQTAARYGTLEIVRFLIENTGAVVDEIPSSDPGDPREVENGTALHKACPEGRYEVMQYLLERGADPMLRDERDRTAADIVKEGKLETEKKLLALLEKYSKSSEEGDLK
ncbi:MAG: hypothetical protein M1814_005821 [Vezdaea aestivalis]|nr:MAG: hypothetical protein M1814_005821 [Vezdaea aestivalis]